MDTAIMLKGAGFCLNFNCIHFGKPNFYMGTEEAYLCTTCEKYGYLEKNKNFYEGYGLIKTAVVHFKFDVISREYLMQASVTNDTLPGNRVMHLYRPFIHFDKSALKIAEQSLAEVATGHKGLIIDFDMDKETFKQALDKLSESLQSEYLKADLGPEFHSLGELT